MNIEKTDIDILSAEGITENLYGAGSALRVEYYSTIDSTNTALRLRGAAGEPEGLLLAASGQTAGRGRLGRSFFSPSDSGVYFSLLLRPEFSPDRAILMTTAAGICVCETVEELVGGKAGIKWVNDIFIDQKKVCGILTEASFQKQDKLDYAVLGIGINVYPGSFPDELNNIAGVLCEKKIPGLRNRIVAGIASRFFDRYLQLGEKSFAEEYRQRSIVIGKDVYLVSGGNYKPARILDIDDACRLRVRYEDMTEAVISTGEISIRMK